MEGTMSNTNLNQYGTKPLTFANYFVYGLGNFASQLSWTMVGTYLSIFYTDVFGLGVGAVAMLMLVAKIWDGINDPMMGTLMERTHTKWGRFRPYIFVGAPFLVIFTILTFTVPGFEGTAKLVYAYVTYIGLGMAYTMTNVPYLALPTVMTRDPKEVNRLNAAQMMGMTVGQIIRNLFVLNLVLCQFRTITRQIYSRNKNTLEIFTAKVINYLVNIDDHILQQRKILFGKTYFLKICPIFLCHIRCIKDIIQRQISVCQKLLNQFGKTVKFHAIFL